MPAIGEMGRRRFLLALSGLGVNALIGACNTPQEPTPRPASALPTATAVPKPPENPIATQEPIKTAPAPLPTSTRTPRIGPLPTVDIPELRRTPAVQSAPKPIPRPTEPPTPTPQPENENPLSFSLLWEKEVPNTMFIPDDLVFADESQFYQFDRQTGLICYPNSETAPKELWRLNRSLSLNRSNFKPLNYDPNFLFTEFLGDLQIRSGRLMAPTTIMVIDKKSGSWQEYRWDQPENGSHQFFFHEGVIERLFSPGGRIETSFEVYSKELKKLWQSPGRLMHTSQKAGVAVVTASSWSRVRDVSVIDLLTGKNSKKLFPEINSDTISGSFYFEGAFVWVVLDNILLKIDLRDPQSKPISIPEIGNNVSFNHNTINNPNLYLTSGKSNVVVYLDKETSRVKWRKYTGGQSIALMGERAGVILARASDSKKVFLFDVHNGDMSEVQDEVPHFEEILGSYKETIVVQGKTQRNTGVWGIDVRNRKLKFSYSGHTVRAAVSGRALVLSIDSSRKLQIVDIETGKETAHTMKGEVAGVVAPKGRLFLVQTGRPKGTLSAITV